MIEGGERSASLEAIEKVANAFGIPLSVLTKAVEKGRPRQSAAYLGQGGNGELPRTTSTSMPIDS